MELNLVHLHEALADRLGPRPCLIWRDQTWTWDEVTDRTRRLASLLAEHGIGRRRDLSECELWESPHDHVGLYLTNSNAYLEGMLGASKAGAAAFNINYRYVAEELTYLLDDASTAALIYHGRYAETLQEVLPHLRRRPLLLRVADGSDDELLPDALDYEQALAASSPERPDVDWRPDDLYIVYTGGTTGKPKGVLWRQADFLVSALGIRATDGSEITHLDQILEPARERHLRALPAPPLMHGAAHWNAISAWLGGGTVVIQSITDRFEPADVLDTCQLHGVTSLLIVGDAFARPLVDELRSRPRDLHSLRFLLTGGAILSRAVRSEIHELLPHTRIVDVLGSSESGRQAVATSRPAAQEPDAGSGSTGFVASTTTTILTDRLDRPLAPHETDIGWLAQGGRIPRGYLGDRDKTRATFPIIDGTRWAVAGDRASWGHDGRVVLHGRESVTINTGGEKVFAEEVEEALKYHPSVYDALVVGRPSERWGQEVVAVVAVRPGHEIDVDDVREVAAEHLARYKLPKAIVVRSAVTRSPSGKPDYAWALSQVSR